MSRSAWELASAALMTHGCDCGEDELGTCLPCLCEAAMREERQRAAGLERERDETRAALASSVPWEPQRVSSDLFTLWRCAGGGWLPDGPGWVPTREGRPVSWAEVEVAVKGEGS